MKLIVIFFSIFMILCSASSQEEAESHSLFRSFNDNGQWAVLLSDLYKAELRKNGTFDIKINNHSFMNASFIERWRSYQHVPYVKLLDAEVFIRKNSKIVVVKYEYLWNDGVMKETLTFTTSSIKVSYSYIPSIKKNIRGFTALLKFDNEKMKNAEIIGMGMQGYDGNILRLDKNKKIKLHMRYIAIRKIDGYDIGLAAEGGSWFSFMFSSSRKWIGGMHNGTFPLWDKILYKKGEKYSLEYFVVISNLRVPSS